MQGAQKWEAGCPGGGSWHSTFSHSSPGQRELWQGLICALGAAALHFSSSCCCSISFSPSPLGFMGFWYLQKFPNQSLRFAKLWAKTFLFALEVPKPQVLPRGVPQQWCAAAWQRRDRKEKIGTFVEPLEDLEFSWERESKNKKLWFPLSVLPPTST